MDFAFGSNLIDQKLSSYTTWKVSAPLGGANPHFFVPERENGLF